MAAATDTPAFSRAKPKVIQVAHLFGQPLFGKGKRLQHSDGQRTIGLANRSEAVCTDGM